MRATRVHDRNGKPYAFVLPTGWREKVALWLRGYRYNPNVLSAVGWWTKHQRSEK